jgi:hypothetical protein
MQNQHLIDEMTERLKELKPYKVILFGSYARGAATEDSEKEDDLKFFHSLSFRIQALSIGLVLAVSLSFLVIFTTS